MKKRTFKPGFEFIFSLSILAVLGLPPLVFAQTTKDLQITINNGDTTVNGKNIKDLSATERKDALKNINQITIISSDSKGQPPMMADNERHVRIMKMRKNAGKDSTMEFSYNLENSPHPKMQFHGTFNDDKMHRGDFNRRNSQNFTYNNIDNEGVVTHVSYHVTDHPAMLDYDAGKQPDMQMDMLELLDLSIVPQFSEGKTLLIFNLASKAPAEVKLKDDKGTLIWSSKVVDGTFSKGFPLGLNGAYYLQVKQGNKVAVKKIEKE